MYRGHGIRGQHRSRGSRGPGLQGEEDARDDLGRR